jgi:superfamily II DNA or RNA helicase
MQLIIRNTYAVVKGTDEEKQRVKDVLTFQDESAKYTHLFQNSKWDGRVKLYKEKDFGLMISPCLKNFLVEKLGNIFEVEDLRGKLVPDADFWNLGIKLRPYQEEAAIIALKEQRGIILVPTAGGKTYIGAAILKGFKNYNCVYIVHRLELLRQTKLALEETLKEDIGILGGGVEDINHRVVVAMIGTLYSKGKSGKSVIEWMDTVQVGVIDEIQHSAAKTYSATIATFKEMSAKIGLTGTIPEDELTALRIRGTMGEVLYSIESEELARDGYVVLPKVKMVQGNWDVGLKEKLKAINWYKFGAERQAWDIVRRYGIITNMFRNQKVADVLNVYKKQGVSGILVIVDLLEHGQLLSELTGEQFIFGEAGGRANVYDDFKTGKIPVLISSPILDEGIDITGIKVVILASGGKSKLRLLQRIGRGMRKQKNKFSCDIVDFQDEEIGMLKRHTEKRLKVYKDEGFVITDFSFQND